VHRIVTGIAALRKAEPHRQGGDPMTAGVLSPWAPSGRPGATPCPWAGCSWPARAWAWARRALPNTFVIGTFYHSLNSYTLLAIGFFVFAGASSPRRAGRPHRGLLASAWGGRVKGGMALVGPSPPCS
jgi:hypothetical protein